MKRDDKFLADRYSNSYVFCLAAILVLIVILENMVFGPKISGLLGNYILPAVMWSLIIVLMIRYPGTRQAGKLRLRKLLCYLAMICATINILAVILQGLLATFGRSPYDLSFPGIIINLVSIGVMVMGTEMIRAWLMNRYFLKRPLFGIPLLALLFTFLFIPFNKISNLQDGMAAIKFVGMSFLPDLGQNVLATYLVFLGGPLPAIIYRGGLLIFERIFPVLPNSNWPIQTLLGTLAPVIGFILVQSIYREESREVRNITQNKEQFGLVLSSVAAIMFIWFSLGVFSYSPRVILSGSMRPNIDIGDIVIIKKISGKQARMGDIIMFPTNNMKVTHRVVDVQQKDGKKYFTTKGDANNEPERDPVVETNVEGKVIMVIPDAGKITILLRGTG